MPNKVTKIAVPITSIAQAVQAAQHLQRVKHDLALIEIAHQERISALQEEFEVDARPLMVLAESLDAELLTFMEVTPNVFDNNATVVHNRVSLKKVDKDVVVLPDEKAIVDYMNTVRSIEKAGHHDWIDRIPRVKKTEIAAAYKNDPSVLDAIDGVGIATSRTVTYKVNRYAVDDTHALKEVSGKKTFPLPDASQSLVE